MTCKFLSSYIFSIFFLKNNVDGRSLPGISDPVQIKKIHDKRKAIQREGITYLMDKHKKKEVPTTYPVAFIHEKIYKNNSEKTRCERYSQKLLNLKSFIENDEYNDKAYVKEVSCLKSLILLINF